MVNNLSILVDDAQLEDQGTSNLAVVVEVFFNAMVLISNASRSDVVVGPTVIIAIEEQQEVGSIIFVQL